LAARLVSRHVPMAVVPSAHSLREPPSHKGPAARRRPARNHEQFPRSVVWCGRGAGRVRPERVSPWRREKNDDEMIARVPSRSHEVLVTAVDEFDRRIKMHDIPGREIEDGGLKPQNRYPWRPADTAKSHRGRCMSLRMDRRPRWHGCLPLAVRPQQCPFRSCFREDL
jgi:hypothetical protein